ncbi:MAG: hypothetical protein ACPHXR_01875 [Flavicella sp.]
METNQTKKYAVLFATFIVPLLFFLFLASGKVNFEKLPTLTERVMELPTNDSKTAFFGKVSVVSFVGNNPSLQKFQETLNLYQVIYKYASKYKNFQIVTLVPSHKDSIIPTFKKELQKVGGTSIPKWHFVSLPEASTQNLLSSFETNAVFDKQSGVAEVYIVDETLNLRGRTDDEDTETGILFGYNTASVSVLKNKLRDDLDVVFYESIYAVKEVENE